MTWHLRRRSVLVAVAGVLLVALTLIGVLQVRAAQARETRAAAAAAQLQQAAADEAARAVAERAEAAGQRAAAAERAAADAAQAALVAAWAAAVAGAEARLAEADVVLAASDGKVGDDAVRHGLVQAMAAVRLLVSAPPAPEQLTATSAAGLDAATAAVAAAAGIVVEAQGTWQAEQEAIAARAAQEAPVAPAPEPARTPGAGPDCGGPESYEPPKDDGRPVFYTSTPSQSGDGSNGRVPASAMSRLGWCTDSQGNGQWLRSDAAAALAALNDAFRTEFGENIAVDMAYRSYQDQVAMRDHYGSLAARPGTSNHGLGLAFDTWEWQAYAFGSARYDWLVANAPAFGWVAPSWARAGGSNPEYWHFEFVG